MLKTIFSLLLLVTTTVVYGLNDTDKQLLPGVELLENGGFENGKARWTPSAGSFAIATSGVNLGNGRSSGLFDATATGQYLTGKQYAIPESLKSKNCLAQIEYKVADASYNFQVYDGSNVITEMVLPASPAWRRADLNFICPASGTLGLRIASTANGAALSLDGGHLGSADNLVSLSQATRFGGSRWEPLSNCYWSKSTNTFDPFAADTDCSTPTLTGNAIALPSKTPSIRFRSLPPGHYMVAVTGEFTKATSSAKALFRLEDSYSGAVSNVGTVYGDSPAVTLGLPTMVFYFDVPATQPDTTWHISGRNNDNTMTYGLSAETAHLMIQVYQFPGAEQQAVVFPSQQGWFVDAHSQNNIPLSTGAVVSPAKIQSSSQSVFPIGGSATVKIPCNGITSNGYDCTGADEITGIVFTTPSAGQYKVCASVEHHRQIAAGSSMDTSFLLVQTEEASDTITYTANDSQWANRLSPVSSNMQLADQGTLCGIFNFAAVGSKVIKIYYSQSVSGSILTNALFSNIRWSVRKVTDSIAQPILVNSVQSSYAGVTGVEWWTAGGALLDGATCSGSPGGITCPTSQKSAGVSHVQRNSQGSYSVYFFAGTWLTAPICFANDSHNVSSTCRASPGGTTTSTPVICQRSDSASPVAVDNHVHIFCIGERK